MSAKHIWSYGAGRLVVAAALCLFATELSTVGAPEIFVNQTSMGVGSVPDDRPVEHCFVIENRGDEILSIDRISEDCEGCVVFSLETNAIAPGRSAVIEMTVDTGVLDGNFAKNLILHTNDPKNPEFILSLWGSVMPGYSVRPRSVAFGTVDKVNAATQVVFVANNIGSSGLLSRVSSSSKNFKGTLCAGPAEGKYELLVSTVPPMPDGLTSSEIILSSSNPAMPRCVVRVAAYVPPAFGVLPAKLKLRATDEDQMMILFIRQNSSSPAKLVDVDLPSPGFRCEINPGPGPSDYRVYVHASGLGGKLGFVGNVMLKTDDPVRAAVAVPVEVQ
ncbi:MAG: DUF1573 domain-containing protein [bacterium]